jgi:hypothetical protein
VRAVLLLLALALVPGIALAHGGHAHSSVEKGNGSVPNEARATFQASLTTTVSPACPSPVHVCGCGNLIACSGENPLVVIAPRASPLQVLADRSRDAVALREPPSPVVSFSAARPRAPPLAGS